MLRIKNIEKKIYRIVKRFMKGETIDEQKAAANNPHRFPSILSADDAKRLHEAITISFTGDLILLRDMVQSAWDEQRKKYDFAPMFEHVKLIWRDANLSVGVLEGPMAGESVGYSTSNFDDNIPLRLNFPDSFCDAIKDADMDIVTLANNHLLDCKQEGLFRTIDVLDQKGLPYFGAYKNSKKDYHEVPIITVRGLRIALLAFTYCPNGETDNLFFDEKTRYLTHGLVAPDSPYFLQNQEQVCAYFVAAKRCHPDMIIALPHMGAQFAAVPDDMQVFWSHYMAEHGADIVLGCHAHHVQPIVWHSVGADKQSLIIYCPGNFVNSYCRENGDLSMLIKVYVDPNTKQAFACGSIPLYAYTDAQHRYIGMPMHTMLTSQLRDTISYQEYRHIEDLHALYGRIVLKRDAFTLDQLQDEYILWQDRGYMRQSVQQVPKKHIEKSLLYQLIDHSSSVCFVGDSITEGTKNGGYGWFEPIMAHFPGKPYYRYAKGGATSEYFKSTIDEYASNPCDLCVIAIGCNDIRYRDISVCAMTSADFVANLQFIADAIKNTHPEGVSIVFIAPWMSADFDPYCPLSIQEKKQLYGEYMDAMQAFCKSNGYHFIDPNPQIAKATSDYRVTRMLKDHIHPNASGGIKLYAEACLEEKA